MQIITNDYDIKGSGIYHIRNLKNGQLYVGSSRCLEDRKYNHEYHLIKQTHSNDKLQKAFNKYGIENFIFEVVDQTTDLLIAEQEFIDLYVRLHGREWLYNLSLVAGRIELSIETRKKISDTKKQRVYPKHKAAMKHLWENRSEELKDKFLVAGKEAWRKQKVFSEETLKELIKMYISMPVPSILKLAEIFKVDYSTIGKIFKKSTSGYNRADYREFLTKIGFEGNSIKDLRRPEIQANLKLT